jgi:hypothetical protein
VLKPSSFHIAVVLGAEHRRRLPARLRKTAVKMENPFETRRLGEPTPSPLFAMYPLENTPVAEPRASQVFRFRITHIYPNFLIFGRKGTPSFPPVHGK